ncbi:MAG: hypothetical protein J3K34DRAFT_266098 [Monoraphidium minutum]|nr:MAG: hypothetical protein J3K34DRAFT_266098 [Monoraphidium minutum]
MAGPLPHGTAPRRSTAAAAALVLSVFLCGLQAARALECPPGSGVKGKKCVACKKGSASPGGTGPCMRCPKPRMMSNGDFTACVCTDTSTDSSSGACSACLAGFGGKACKKCAGTKKFSHAGRGIAACLTCPKATAPFATADKTGCKCTDTSMVWVRDSCMPPCPGGKVHNQETKECVCPSATPEEFGGQCVAACAGGRERNSGSGACECPALKPDLFQDACVAACTGGTQRNQATGACQCPPATPDLVGGVCIAACAVTGQTRDAAGGCVCPLAIPEVFGGACVAACTGGTVRNATTGVCGCVQPTPDLVNGACYAPCTNGKEHHPTTGVCECRGATPDEVAGSCYPACSGGAVHDATNGTCVCPANLPDLWNSVCKAACTGGTERNAGTGLCVCPPSTPEVFGGACVAACTGGTVRNATTGVCGCVQPTPDLVNGACYAPCTNGKEHHPTTGVCECRGATPDEVAGSCYPACSGGAVHDATNGTCVCPANLPDLWNGVCKAACTGGTERNAGTGLCECPPATPDLVGGICYPACTVTGQTHNATGGCVCPLAIPEVFGGACVAACTGGTVRNATSGVCVCPPATPDLVGGICYPACTVTGQTHNTTGGCGCPAASPEIAQNTCVASCPFGTARNATGTNCVALPGLYNECMQASQDTCTAQALCTNQSASTYGCQCLEGNTGAACTPTAACSASPNIAITCAQAPVSCRYYQEGSVVDVETSTTSICTVDYAGATRYLNKQPLNPGTFQYSSLQPDTGTYYQDYWSLKCPPAGASASWSVSAAWITSALCMKQQRHSLATDPVPDCTPPAATWPCVANGACWLDTGDRAAVKAAYQAFIGRDLGASHMDDGYLNACMHKGAWTGGNVGTCTAGADSENLKAWNLAHMNFYRAMAGVRADIARLTQFDADVLQTALMMSAQNDLDHYPTAGWACYTPAGAAAATSNLALGVCGVSATRAFMYDDGDNNKPVGHRVNMLNPDIQYSTTGDVFPATSWACAQAQSIWQAPPGWVAQMQPTRAAYIAWPPAGFVPASIVFPRWHFSWPRAPTVDLSTNVAVAMTRGGVPVSLIIVHQAASKIVWEPNDPTLNAFWSRLYQPAADVPITVTLSTIVPATAFASYTVTVFGVENMAYGLHAALPLEPPIAGAAPSGVGPASMAAGDAGGGAPGLPPVVVDESRAGRLGPAPEMPAGWGKA